MTAVSTDQRQELVTRIEQIRVRMRVPGVTLCVGHDDAILEATSGVANATTGQPMTPDTLFMIGSISKIFTTSLVMRLVELGRIDLAAPIRKYLPDFRVADPEITEIVTVRHLLTHSSGIDGGDYCFDGGRGDDGIARYVASCAALGRLHAPGELTSYCNAGFVIAGRVVEVVTGETFDVSQRRELLEPLLLDATCTRPEAAIVRRVAVGHWPQPDGAYRATRTWMYTPAAGPCGTMIAAPARDVVAFARMHLREGRSRRGENVLSAASVDAMQTVQYPDAFGGSRSVDLGLGWMIEGAGPARVLSHFGGSPGGVAMLQLVPDRDFSAVVFCNAYGGRPACEEVMRAAMEVVLGTMPSAAAGPAPAPQNLDAHVGAYERWGRTVHVSLDAASLRMSSVDRVGRAWYPADADVRPSEMPSPTATTHLAPVDQRRLAPVDGPKHSGSYISFVDLDGDGRSDYLFEFYRAHLRIE